MVGYAKHNGEQQHFVRVVELVEIIQLFSHLFPTILVAHYVFELEFPRMILVLDVRAVKTLSKPLYIGLTHNIVCPLEVPMQNISLSPGPSISQTLLFLVRKQKSLNYSFEFPKRSTTRHIMSIFFSP